MAKITVVNTYTGELMPFEWSNDLEMAQAYYAIQQTIKALERAKMKFKDKMIDRIDDTHLEVGKDFIWHKSIRRYKNYNIYALREAIEDNDLFIEVVKPDKVFIDKMIKESIDSLDPVFSKDTVKMLKETMTEDRTPVIALTLERIEHEAQEATGL